MKIIQHLFILLLGAIVIIFFFWLRILRHFDEKKPLYVFPEYFSKFILFIFILYYIYGLYSAILEILNKKSANKLIVFIQKQLQDTVLLTIVVAIKESPKIFYKTVIYSYFKVVYIIERPLYTIAKKFSCKPKDILYLTFNLIPRIIVSTLFLLSIFYLKVLPYFIVSIFLLVLPLFYSCYYYIANHLCDENIPYFRDHLQFKESQEEGFLNVEFAEVIPDYPDAEDIIKHKNNKPLLQWFAMNYEIYTNLKSFLKKLQKLEDKYKLYENLYVYTCYIIGWSYILYLIC